MCATGKVEGRTSCRSKKSDHMCEELWIVHADNHNVDAAQLRRKLQELQRNTEQLKKDRGIRHQEL